MRSLKMPDSQGPDKLRPFAVKTDAKKKKASKSSKKEPNPLDKAMDILDGYYNGTPPMELKGCGCCGKEDEEDEPPK
ncbi:MAG: hypothetical protein AABX47_02040 [Nanoarchaeota archaeon]